MLDGEPCTVIGVMPPRFEWNIADLWVPAAMIRTDEPQSPRGFRAVPGTPEAWCHRPGGRSAAERHRRAAVGRASHRLSRGFRFEVIPVVDWVVREFRGVRIFSSAQ